jgi:hypothetical protein
MAWISAWISGYFPEPAETSGVKIRLGVCPKIIYYGNK